MISVTSEQPEHSNCDRGARRRLSAGSVFLEAPAVLAQAILVAAVLVAPWLLGGVLAAAQTWLFAAVAAALVFLLAHLLLHRSDRPALPIVLIPLLLAIALGVFQLIPLPANVVAALSPGAAKWRAELLPPADTPLELAAVGSTQPSGGSMAALERAMPLSLYSASTRHDLTLLVLATSVFLLGAMLFRTRRALAWLCIAVAVNGALLAAFGMVQQLRWNGQIYWHVPLQHGGGPFGPFVNRNNGAGYLNLTLAAAAALLVWTFGRSSGPEYSVRPDRGRAARAWRRLTWSMAHLDAPKLYALFGVAMIAAGILCSLSRGAFLAMLAALAVTLVCLFVAQGHTRLARLAAVVGVSAVLLVGWVDRIEPVKARLSTLFGDQVLSNERLLHWSESLRAAPDFRWLGGGLGTYRYIYPAYASSPQRAWFYHAEDQYIESLVDAGLVGLGLLLAAIGLTGALVWRLFRAGRSRGALAIAVLGAYALASQLVAGAFDFGLYLPANFMLLALICGGVCGYSVRAARAGGGGRAAVGVSSRRRRGRSSLEKDHSLTGAWRAARRPAVAAAASGGAAEPGSHDAGSAVTARVARTRSAPSLRSPATARSASSGPRSSAADSPRAGASWLALPGGGVLAPILALVLLGGVLLGQAQSRSAAAVEHALAGADRVVRTIGAKAPASAGAVEALDSQLRGCIDQLSAAAAKDPENAEAHRSLALLWTRLYQVDAFRQLRFQPPEGVDRDQLWLAASTAGLHARVLGLIRTGQFQQLDRLRRHPIVASTVQPAYEQFLLARRACPLLAEAHLGLGRLCLAAADASEPVERMHLDRARKLAPADPGLLYRAGLLDYHAGRTERYCRSWRASLALSGQFEAPIIRLASQRLAPKQMARDLFPPQPELLVRLARTRYAGPESRELRNLLLARADRLLDDPAVAPDQRQYLAGVIAALEGRTAQAVEHYRRAIQLRSWDLTWRYEYAVLLQQQGLLDQAHQEAKWCARAAPRQPKYRLLLEQIQQARLRETRGA